MECPSLGIALLIHIKMLLETLAYFRGGHFFLPREQNVIFFMLNNIFVNFFGIGYLFLNLCNMPIWFHGIISSFNVLILRIHF